MNEINYYKCVIKCQYNIKENNKKNKRKQFKNIYNYIYMIDPIIAPLLLVGSIFIGLCVYMVDECVGGTRMRNAIRENPADYLWYPNKDY